jgi:hypothetical protein
MEAFSAFIPRWLQKLSNPACKPVLFYGCGGGFDFTHSLLLIPSLLTAGKKVVILSNSFTDITRAYSSHQTYFQDPQTRAHVKLVRPGGTGKSHVLEQAIVDFLLERFPGVTVYADNIHVISPAGITQTLKNLIVEHSVDVIVTIDGGTDSLMRGDEEDYATIIEDFVSLAILENLRTTTPRLQAAMLLVVGFGVDRFHGASDASSLRAVAELTRMGGFLGVSSIEQASVAFATYTDFLLYYRDRYGSESGIQTIVGAMVAAATVGQYGPYQTDVVPKDVPRNFERSGIPASAVELFGLDKAGTGSASLNNPRVLEKDGYIWPLMGQIFGFDIAVIMERNLIAPTFRAAKTWIEVDTMFRGLRKKLKPGKLGIEDIPRQVEMAKKTRDS